MKLTDTSQICPYTGLRSFTEEESLYFKGRDEQVDLVTAQLEERKFLMLTGASGEGKSSLIYAGLIPNARAGFFKSKYANWTVVDFRPERSPVRSMARALADKFSASPETIETEIRRGFSSLVDLYLNSKFHVADTPREQASDAEKKSRSRNASNLLILVDQFEEFFTNPENYHNEHPSADSQIVVNLILETSRIALQQGLPIYVVCTMRSDYIGQCSSFRGLPEYIGYSQFFVPRLKRKELKQVIEEPALLSGNRISQRLTERLVYDLAEGVDQLPILQHALSQIWLMANRGTEEMDLVHYAMVGGMPAHELPEKEAALFSEWFNNLPEFQRDFYSETGLNKVIENHARRLYEASADHYNTKHGDNPITVKDAKNIIALTFSCLTKIDNSRAVRNRMTLKEITAVINRPSLPSHVVGKVLDIFREEGNSFVRPFITEDSDARNLSEDTVLDITHESLIRNWGMLNKWAKQEYEFYSTFLDLKKQLDRWKSHGKSKGYLLPIGPLSYFENWYKKCNPNVAWISRYFEPGYSEKQHASQADALLEDIREYLRRSARNVTVSRAFVKYGAKKIGLITLVIIGLLLAGFYTVDSLKKRNDVVIKRIQDESQTLLASTAVPNGTKAEHLFINERLESGSLIGYLRSASNPRDRLALSTTVYSELIVRDKKYQGPLRKDVIDLIEQTLKSAKDQGDEETLVARLNEFLFALMYDNYYNPEVGLEKLLEQEASFMYSLIVRSFQNEERYKVSVAIGLNNGIQNWLTFGKPTKEQITTLINMISPMSGPAAQKTFDVFYPKGSYESNGLRANDYNGGYQTIASLYAAAGNVEGVKWCFEKLKSQPDFFSDRLFNNYANVVGYLYQYGHRSLVSHVVSYLSENHRALLPQVVYREMLVRSGYISHLFRVNFGIRRPQTEEGTLFPNLCLSSVDQVSAIANDYENSLASLKDPNDRNFGLAILYKRIAMASHKYHFDRGLPVSTASLDALLDKAWEHYSLISEAELDKLTPVSFLVVTESRITEVKRRHVFLYPDYIGSWQSARYHTDLFLAYILKKDLIENAYKTLEDLNQIHFWLSGMNEPFLVEIAAVTNNYQPNDSLLAATWDQIRQHKEGGTFDANLFALILSNNAFSREDTTNAMSYYKRLQQRSTISSGNQYETFNRSFFYNQMMALAKNLALIGKSREAVNIIQKIPDNSRQITAYLFTADQLYEHGVSSARSVFLDSAVTRMKIVNLGSVPPFLDYRGKAISIMNKIGGRLINSGTELYKEIPEPRKFAATERMIKGIAGRKDYYAAYATIPRTLTEQEDLICRNAILLKAAREYEKKNNLKGWPAFDWSMEWNDHNVLFFGFL